MGAGLESQAVNLKSIIKLSEGKGEMTKAYYFVLSLKTVSFKTQVLLYSPAFRKLPHRICGKRRGGGRGILKG